MRVLGGLRAGVAVLSCALAQGAMADEAWTKADRDRVLTAAGDAAQDAKSPAGKAAMMVQLARRYRDAGDADQARHWALQAGAVFGGAPDLDAMPPVTEAIALLAALGDAQDAAKVADAGGPVAIRAKLLGALGRSLAEAHDKAGVADAIRRIQALPDTAAGPDADKLEALGDVGAALAQNGQVEAAQALSGSVPAGGPALRLKAEIAFALCRNGPSAQGAAAAQAAADALMHPAGGKPDAGGPTFAAAAAAACEGPDKAEAIIANASANPSMTRPAVLSVLSAAGLDRAVASLSPAPDPGDAVALAEAARRARDAGDAAGAHRLAAQAVQAAAKTHDPHDQSMALSAAFSVLAASGAYDEALDAVGKMNLPSRRGYSLNLVHQAAEKHDDAAVRRLVPKSVALMTAPSPFQSMARLQMADMAVMLAQDGYKDEAGEVFHALSPPNDDDDDYYGGRYAAVQAVLGDADGAMKTAVAAGPMVVAVEAPGDLPGQAPAPGAGKPDAAYRAGPQAEALSMLASVFADAGQISRAEAARAKLDAPVPDAQKAALQGDRDDAQAAIADAQAKAGHPQAALQTVMQIQSGAKRMPVLMTLLSLPVR